MLPLPCMLVCIFVCANRTRDRGCSKHPVFPVPSDKEGANEHANLGRSAPRECETISIRHCERSEAIHVAAQRKNGLLRGACHRAHIRATRWLAMTRRESSSSVGSFDYEDSARCRRAYKSCRVSLPGGAADRPSAFFAGISPPASAITETETTRSTMASTSLRSHCPSDNLVSRSFSRMV